MKKEHCLLHYGETGSPGGPKLGSHPVCGTAEAGKSYPFVDDNKAQIDGYVSHD